MSAKEWQIKERTTADLLDQLLLNRGITDKESFLAPDYRQLHDPFQLKQMKEAVERLEQAIVQGQSIAIFGDYDHDGTPAAALLADALKAAGAVIKTVYIPTREEGYSITKTVVDGMAKEGIKLLILVDCGITNREEVNYALELGIESLVIDHHIVQADKSPDKAIVINPKQKGDSYPFQELCGCGLAFKVMQALAEKTGRLKPNQLKWYLDLVAISTLCDMVPLVDENRILVHYGLIVLRQTRRLGLQALLEAAAVIPENITTYTVGFVIGPRLNAAGRIERASLAYELLVSRDEQEAKQLAAKLERLNKQRQAELDKVLQEAEAVVLKDKLDQKKVILVAGDGWSDGVVGLVAGRLTEKYHRPTFVLTNRTDGLSKGSARSIDGFHLVEALQECGRHLVKYGGHAKAAGLTLVKEQLTTLYDRLVELASQQLTDDRLRPRLRIEAKLQDSEITLRTAQALLKLEPYGLGNSRPVLMIPNVEVVAVQTMGKPANHLKLQLLTDQGRAFEAVGFGMAGRKAECLVGTRLDVAGLLDINEWQGTKRLQFKLIDWRPASRTDMDRVTEEIEIPMKTSTAKGS